MDSLPWRIFSSALAAVASASSLLQILCHLRNYTQPALQRYVVRIIFLVPLYAASSCLSLWFPQYSIYFDTPTGCYEAFVIWVFMSLLFGYVGGPGAVVAQAEGCIVQPSWHWMTCCLPPMPVDGVFLRRCKQLVLQFVLLKPLLALLVVILYSCGKYTAGVWAWGDSFPYIYVTLNICYSLALYALIVFYLGVRGVLQAHRPGLKFLVVKGSIFLPFFMGTAISVVAGSFDVLQGPYDAQQVQSFAVCAAMAAACLLMWAAFPHRIYKIGGQTVGLRLAAVVHALSLEDVISDANHQFNPMYETYVLHHDGGPAAMSQFRRGAGNRDCADFTLSADRDSGPPHHAVQLGHLPVSHVPGASGAGRLPPSARRHASSSGDSSSNLGFVKRMLQSSRTSLSAAGGITLEEQRKQAELLGSDSDDADDDDVPDNQFDDQLILPRPRSVGGGANGRIDNAGGSV